MKALAAVNETDGAYVTVSDEEILAAIPALAQGCGVFAEPAGATAYAGLRKAVEMQLIGSDEHIVVINTGNGLKDVQAAMKGVETAGIRPYLIQPNLEEVKRVINPDPADF